MFLWNDSIYRFPYMCTAIYWASSLLYGMMLTSMTCSLLLNFTSHGRLCMKQLQLANEQNIQEACEYSLVMVIAIIQIRYKFVWYTSISGYHIAIKFCTCHESLVVVPCAKSNSHHFAITWLRPKWMFHRIWITVENEIQNSELWSYMNRVMELHKAMT